MATERTESADNRWRAYERTFSDGRQETRFIREIVYGKRRSQQYRQLTTDTETLPTCLALGLWE